MTCASWARALRSGTHRGLVQLSGFADSQMEADRAGQLAQNVHGVREVKDILLKQ
jgi:osmotically-inducible protein OsmY